LAPTASPRTAKNIEDARMKRREEDGSQFMLTAKAGLRLTF
jgi:hypothetical protein